MTGTLIQKAGAVIPKYMFMSMNRMQDIITT
jgi:hypothetical protein